MTSLEPTRRDGSFGAQRQVSEGSLPIRRTQSFLNPTGAKADIAPPKELGPVAELVIFVVFAMIRAFHPVIIDASKSVDEHGKKFFAYQASSTVVASVIILLIISHIGVYIVGGQKQYDSIWEPKPLLVFSINGLVYSFGDYLEMASMGSLQGAAYQILMQSKIIITACLMICAKGVYQTRLQWILLVILMCSMSGYMVIESGGKGSDGGIPLVGMLLAFLKVLMSCIGAVVSDKFMKVYKDEPFLVQIARIWLAQAVGIVLLSFTSDIWRVGFFSGWDERTCAVLGSFLIKTSATLYIVSILDSILKNIAESFAVLIIYGYDVLAPWVDKSFNVATFLSVLVVVAACAAYVDSKVPIEKAAKYDKYEADQELMRKSKEALNRMG
jgi:hypothetical protein